MAGRSVKLFLADGTPYGIRTAELGNWTGKAVVCPRSDLAKLGKRPEASRTGVYLLIGADDAAPSGLAIYVGEGDEVWSRIAKHDKDPKKEFWTRVAVFVSKDANLTKSHARWLESKLVSELTTAKQARVINATQPTGGGLPEADEADMETYFANLRVLLPLLGVDVMTQPAPAGIESKPDSDPLELVLSRKSISAGCRIIDGRFVVQAGSEAVATAKKSLTTSNPGWAQLRQWLIGERVLAVNPASTSRLTFTQDYAFESPSAAASVITGTAINGRKAWRVKAGNGITYADWQEQELIGQDG
jgi:hypothetical protein